MNKTKTIYFLSAVVLIIGCYALNLSYSLFVQTEDKEIVNATVPSLLYNLEQEEFLIKPNEKTIITLSPHRGRKQPQHREQIYAAARC